MIIFDLNMKTNFMIALNTQWKAPWRTPKVDIPLNPKTSMGKQLDNRFKNMLGRTVKGVQNFVIKNMLE